uniref:Uncharacterized protein TCIL3000_6_4020 n=1 Tax=Trypanosoma congolense (strain IL3000) TaxID=1068625 RepID=G0UP35_TRYCI|nr:unnamed protein product [Trypanosoma congolense IL3000]
MQKFRRVTVNSWNLVRFHAAYGAAPLSHSEISSFYKKGENVVDELHLLEMVEERIFSWKLNKWEMRIPPHLSNNQKELMRREQEHLRCTILEWKKCVDSFRADAALIAQLTNISQGAVREKNRLWLQEEVARLRWMGEINKATALRDAFMRLETIGSRDFMLLERMCCVYGLARQGTFGDAFSNYIVEDPITKNVFVDQENPFNDFVAYVVRRHMQIDMVYDFLGFNFTEGYRHSLWRYLAYLQSKVNENIMVKGRLIHGKERCDVLFDCCNSGGSMASGESGQGMIDFLYVNGNDITIIVIASDNPWLRNRQLPHRRQMEGIARRACFVLGIPPSEVRVRNLLLPPTYLDRDSVIRINEVVFRLSDEEVNRLVPWLSVYRKELDARDVDFSALMKATNDEEWLTL